MNEYSADLDSAWRSLARQDLARATAVATIAAAKAIERMEKRQEEDAAFWKDLVKKEGRG